MSPFPEFFHPASALLSTEIHIWNENEKLEKSFFDWGGGGGCIYISFKNEVFGNILLENILLKMKLFVLPTPNYRV